LRAKSPRKVADIALGRDVNPGRFIVFIDFADGKPSVGRTIVANAQTVEYVRGLAALDVKDEVKLARFCAGFLKSRDPEVGQDVVHEFTTSSAPALQKALAGFPPSTLRELVAERTTPPLKRDLCAYLLGYCGDARDAELLRNLVAFDPAVHDLEPFLKGA